MSGAPFHKMIASAPFAVALSIPKEDFDAALRPGANALSHMHLNSRHISSVEEILRRRFANRIAASSMSGDLACDVVFADAVHKTEIKMTPLFTEEHYYALVIPGKFVFEGNLANCHEASPFQTLLSMLAEADVAPDGADGRYDHLDLKESASGRAILSEFLNDLGLSGADADRFGRPESRFAVEVIGDLKPSLSITLDVPDGGERNIRKLIRLPYERFATIESAPVAEDSTGTSAVHSSSEAQFWSIYGRCKETGLAECLLDVKTERDAAEALSWIEAYASVRRLDLETIGFSNPEPMSPAVSP